MWRWICHFLALLKGEIPYPGATDEAALRGSIDDADLQIPESLVP